MVPSVSPPSRARLRLVSPEDAATTGSASGLKDRYSGIADRRLAAILAAEDVAEEYGLSAHVRTTCYVHRCWVHQCISDPLHVLVVTGHRWCRRCDRTVDVEIDETAPGSVELYCDGCGVPPDTVANREVVFSCRSSLVAMYGGEASTPYVVPDC
ncbi:hypothetical protein [Amycolatopsis decaplanina]|uniref:Uncharacterized protein n=1 Tax=Amycolatopsis decaplanina DSM 44594 TaxID=1284240 RepID=M2XC04_9PSEU|nr:hypothetical protein [Amycolatopsis decaplanina]EME58631.1 hypothetical protein H074_18668 [Amycolatopsis decaplanina DSM 44594]